MALKMRERKMSAAGNVEEIIASLSPYERMILYAAGSSGKTLKSKVKMQKLIFLCSEALPEIFNGSLSFEPQRKGPYSAEIDGLIVSVGDKMLMTVPDCALTELGNEVLKGMDTEEPVKSAIDEYKEFICSLTEDEFLTFVYVTFPNFRANSEEWERLRPIREKVAGSLLEKGAVSFSRAAEISGKDANAFHDYLVRSKIRWRNV